MEADAAGPAMDTAELVPLWSCATSLLVCLSVRGAADARHEQAVRAVHARQLLLACDGDLWWLSAAAGTARRRARAASRPWGGVPVARRRLGRRGDRHWRYALGALTRGSRDTVAAHWTAGAELAEAAAGLLTGAGAGPAARDRALADAHRVLDRLDWGDPAGTVPQ